VHLLVEFFTDRLLNTNDGQNRAGIKESAEALSTLIGHDEGRKFIPGDAEIVIRAVFAVDSNDLLRDMKASGRLALYDLLSLLMQKFRPQIMRYFGRIEFTAGLVSMATLEKDPSNLRRIFEMYEDLSKNWELDSTTCLEIWESFSRYFPITLSRVSADPNVPTPDELKALLVRCLVSHDVYATEVFPRLIEMLDTNSDLSANVKVRV